LRKFILLLTAFFFLFGCLFAVPQASIAVPKWGHPVFGTDWVPGDEDEAEGENEATDEEVYEKDRGPAWARDEHPSLQGLRRAYENVSKNGASPVAQQVLKRLIEARTVSEEIYELEETTEDEEALEAVAGNEEVREALVREAKRVRAEIRQQFGEEKALAWALKKLGKAMYKLGDRIAAEETLVEAAGIAREDKEVYEALNEMYARMPGKEMPVFIKGEKVQFDVPPRVVKGRTLVPLRKLAEALEGTVAWDAVNRQVVLSQGTKVIVLGIGKTTANVDGQEVALDVPAVIVNGRVLVPLRFVSEALDAQVDYYPASSMVVVH